MMKRPARRPATLFLPFLLLGPGCASGDPGNSKPDPQNPAPEEPGTSEGTMTETPDPALSDSGSADAEPTATPAAASLARGDQEFRARKYKEAFEPYLESIDLAEASGEQGVLVEALAQVARLHSIQKPLAKGQPYLDRAASLARPEESASWTRFLTVRGVFERESGRQAEAKQTFLELLDYAEKRDLHDTAQDAIHHLAIATPLEEQIQWALRGIELAERSDEKRWLAVLWNNLGNSYEDAHKPQDALAAWLSARQYHYEVGTWLNKLIADWAVGRGYRLTLDLSAARQWIELCEDRFQRVHGIEPNETTTEWLGMCHWELGEIALQERKFSEAERELSRARKELVGIGIQTWWSEGLEKLDASLAKAQGATADG